MLYGEEMPRPQVHDVLRPLYRGPSLDPADPPAFISGTFKAVVQDAGALSALQEAGPVCYGGAVFWAEGGEVHGSPCRIAGFDGDCEPALLAYEDSPGEDEAVAVYEVLVARGPLAHFFGEAGDSGTLYAPVARGFRRVRFRHADAVVLGAPAAVGGVNSAAPAMAESLALTS